MKRKKLTIAEQIQDMHTKGISFNYNNEKEVSDFLSHNNYYFKLKSYGKNYDKYHATEKKGKYINLDFAYLQELSTLDMYLRKVIIPHIHPKKMIIAATSGLLNFYAMLLHIIIAY